MARFIGEGRWTGVDTRADVLGDGRVRLPGGEVVGPAAGYVTDADGPLPPGTRTSELGPNDARNPRKEAGP